MDEKNLHDGLPPLLSVDNIADGALHELLQRELSRVAENINDPNTSSTQKRKVSISFEFTPYLDRTGATVSTAIKSTLSGVKAVESTMYIANKGGQWLTFGKNHKQQEMQFDMNQAADKTLKPQ